MIESNQSNSSEMRREFHRQMNECIENLSIWLVLPPPPREFVDGVTQQDKWLSDEDIAAAKRVIKIIASRMPREVVDRKYERFWA